MRFEYAFLRNFPPFLDQAIKFPPLREHGKTGEVQLLTGENGTGKTRLLCLFAAACGNPGDLDARVAKSQQTNARVLACFANKQAIWDRNAGQFRIPNEKLSKENLWSHFLRKEPFDTIRPAKRQIALLDDDPTVARRGALAFRGTVRAADSKILAMHPVDLGSRKEHLSFDPAKNEDALVCQSMANLKMGAAMEVLSKVPREQARSLKIVERLESAVSKITGREFSFDVTPHPEVRLRVFWGGVTMRLSELPDGLRSIIGWLVSCIAKLESQFPDHSDPLNIPLILLLDEPESHLHPAWQRKVLPAAQTLLPHSQMFVATHSPFVISSVNDGWVHILRADETGSVKADPPIPCSEGDSFLDVVEDILGVKEWYDPETEQLLVEFRALRERVLNCDGDVEELSGKAAVIAGRGDSLREMMAREMHQVERLMRQGAEQT